MKVCNSICVLLGLERVVFFIEVDCITHVFSTLEKPIFQLIVDFGFKDQDNEDYLYHFFDLISLLMVLL